MFINVFTLIEKLKIEMLTKFNSNYSEDLACKFDIIKEEVSKIKKAARYWKEKALTYEIELEKLQKEIKEYQEVISEYDKEML